MRGFGAPELWQPNRTPSPPHEKPRHHPKMLTGFFMLSPLSRLLHLSRKMPGRRLRSRPGEIIQPSKVSRYGLTESDLIFPTQQSVDLFALCREPNGWPCVLGLRVRSPHADKQAELLAGLALSANDPNQGRTVQTGCDGAARPRAKRRISRAEPISCHRRRPAAAVLNGEQAARLGLRAASALKERISRIRIVRSEKIGGVS